MKRDYSEYYLVGILAPYDRSVELRELHDAKMDLEFNRPTEEQRRAFSSGSEKKGKKKKIQFLKPGEEVVNPWL